MAKDITALAFDRVIDFKISEDGRHLLLCVESATKIQMWLSLPIDQADRLVIAGGMGSKKTLSPIWWDNEKDPEETGSGVLSVTISPGSTLRYRLDASNQRGKLRYKVK